MHQKYMKIWDKIFDVTLSRIVTIDIFIQKHVGKLKLTISATQFKLPHNIKAIEIKLKHIIQ